MGPAITTMLLLHLRLVTSAQFLRMLTRFRRFGDLGRRGQLVSLIPARRILLQGGDHCRQFVFQATPWFPTQQFPGARNIEFVVVVCHSHHERLDERPLALVERIGNEWLDLVLRPGAHCRNGLWHAQSRPFLGAVNQISDLVLERVISEGLLFADQDHRSRRNLLPPVNGTAEGIEHVVPVKHRLADGRRARIEMALEIALIDAGDLVGECRHRSLLVVKPGEMEQHIGNASMLGRGLPPRPPPLIWDKPSQARSDDLR